MGRFETDRHGQLENQPHCLIGACVQFRVNTFPAPSTHFNGRSGKRSEVDLRLNQDFRLHTTK